MTDETPQKPTDRLTISVNDKEQTVFMSGGLIRKIMPYFAQYDDFTNVFSDFEMQNLLVVELVRPRTERGEARKDYTIEDFQITQEETLKLVEWTVEHVLSFFIDTMKTSKRLADNNQHQVAVLTALLQSMTGSQASQEQKLSAGASESSPQTQT